MEGLQIELMSAAAKSWGVQASRLRNLINLCSVVNRDSWIFIYNGDNEVGAEADRREIGLTLGLRVRGMLDITQCVIQDVLATVKRP
jgi:hypothetical protein